MEVLQRLSIVLPSTGLHADRQVLETLAVAVGHAPDRPLIDGLDVTIMGPERIALAGRRLRARLPGIEADLVRAQRLERERIVLADHDVVAARLRAEPATRRPGWSKP